MASQFSMMQPPNAAVDSWPIITAVLLLLIQGIITVHHLLNDHRFRTVWKLALSQQPSVDPLEETEILSARNRTPEKVALESCFSPSIRLLTFATSATKTRYGLRFLQHLVATVFALTVLPHYLACVLRMKKCIHLAVALKLYRLTWSTTDSVANLSRRFAQRALSGRPRIGPTATIRNVRSSSLRKGS